MRSSEIEQHKADITEKEVEIQQLLQKLQEQQATQHQHHLKEEMKQEVEGDLDELQAQLLEVKQAKERAEGELAAAQLRVDMLREREDEYRRLEVAAQTRVCFYCGVYI